MSRARAPAFCAVCGAAIPAQARACPGCGADERTGWSESTESDALDLPDEEFDYEGFVEKEFGGGVPHKGKPLFWWIVAVGLLAVMVCLVLKNHF
jgi:hypothetical protein